MLSIHKFYCAVMCGYFMCDVCHYALSGIAKWWWLLAEMHSFFFYLTQQWDEYLFMSATLFFCFFFCFCFVFFFLIMCTDNSQDSWHSKLFIKREFFFCPPSVSWSAYICCLEVWTTNNTIHGCNLTFEAALHDFIWRTSTNEWHCCSEKNFIMQTRWNIA